MFPLLFPILGLLVAGTVVAYWDHIREWAMDTATRWVERHWGRAAGKAFRYLIVKLDWAIVRGRRVVRRLLRGERYSASTVLSEEVIPAEDLPDELRSELRHGPVTQAYEVCA